MTQALKHRGSGANSLIALGGNIPSEAGDPEETLIAAIGEIAEHVGRVTAASRLFSTPCFPPGAGPDFVNGACAVAVTAEPAEVLAALHDIERRFGRIRRERWATRALDLDLLAYGDLVLPDAATQSAWRAVPPERQKVEAPDELVLPHPRLQDRGFVLVPLMDVAANWRHPVLGQTVAEMCAALPDEERADIRPLDRVIPDFLLVNTAPGS